MRPKLHVALNVNSLEESLAFYRALWGVEPVKVRRGYAKFDLAEPSVNLTLNERPVKEVGGINHMAFRWRALKRCWLCEGGSRRAAGSPKMRCKPTAAQRFRTRSG